MKRSEKRPHQPKRCMLCNLRESESGETYRAIAYLDEKTGEIGQYWYCARDYRRVVGEYQRIDWHGIGQKEGGE